MRIVKNMEKFTDILVCPEDHHRLIHENDKFRCENCSKEYTIINGVANFLSSTAENSSYDIPWHQIPEINLKNRFISKIRKFPIYWRLIFSSDYFSFLLEKTIFNHVRKSNTVLDIGCREGTNLVYASNNNTCFGVDVDYKSVCYANAISPPNSIAMLASGTKLPFQKEHFDFIICTDVIEHVEDYNQLINEISRVGKSQGCTLVLTTPDGDVVPEPYELHYRHFRRKQLEEMLKNYFSTVHVKSIPRNCKVKKLSWWYHDKYDRKFRIVYIMINFITNILYFLGGYHKNIYSPKSDVTDSTFIIIASR